jgi:hypothetical protein
MLSIVKEGQHHEISIMRQSKKHKAMLITVRTKPAKGSMLDAGG